MKLILRRWLSWFFDKPSDWRRVPGTPPVRAVDRRTPSSLPMGVEGHTASEPAAIGARRPLIGSDGAVAGFEFRLGDEATRHLKRQSDAHARNARVTVLLASAHAVVRVGRIGFVRMPSEWLVQASDAEVEPGILIGLESAPAVVPVPQATGTTERAVLALRAKGVQVGWGPDFAAQIPPDFVFLRQGANAMSTLLDCRATWPPQWQGLPVLVTDISDVEELEMALYNGVSYACGALDGETTTAGPASRHPVPPEVRRVGLLLNQLASGADTAVIVGQIKGDVGLSYRLLRLINSANYAQLGSYASVEQAVLLLGRYELYRWLSMLLVQFAGSRKAASALQEMALWRSRLLELLAIDRQEDAPDQFFTLGLASMLGQLLKISQMDVASTLNLPAFATQALLEHSGPWYPYLHMATRIEAHALDQSAELAAPFGGAARLLMLSDRAWRWAAEQTAHADAKGLPHGSATE